MRPEQELDNCLHQSSPVTFACPVPELAVAETILQHAIFTGQILRLAFHPDFLLPQFYGLEPSPLDLSRRLRLLRTGVERPLP